MEIHTQRFGVVQIESDEVIVFSEGLAGHPSIRHWVLLADAAHQSLYWLQAVANHQLAIPVICPTEVAADFQPRLRSRDLQSIKAGHDTPVLLLIEADKALEESRLGGTNRLIINIAHRLGCQREIHDEHSAQVELPQQTAPLRKSA